MLDRCFSSTTGMPSGGSQLEATSRSTNTPPTREIFEELEVAPRFHVAVGAKPLMVTVTRTQGGSEPHTDVSLWFVFDGSEDAVFAPDGAEFADTNWWSFDDIRHDGPVAFDPHLSRFIDKLRAHRDLRVPHPPTTSHQMSVGYTPIGWAGTTNRRGTRRERHLLWGTGVGAGRP